MKYEVVPSNNTPDEWRAEAIDDEGRCYVVIFSGPNAYSRANDYADTENFTGEGQK
jgi:hypothetical protein